MNADVVIIGAGPAGIFTALEMIKKGSRQKIIMVEKGQAVENRHCPKDKTKKCVNCKPYCHITTGFSGAGAFSDGKLSLSYEVGGDLPTLITPELAQETINYADQIYLDFGADEHIEGLGNDEERKEIRKHVCACRDLPFDEALRRVEAGEPFVIRQRIPQEGTTTFHDVSFGDITVENKELEDQVLLKSDGLPTYNFANVVDDHLMGITHVVRGSEYLSSAPKYNLLYEGLGWGVPSYVHCSPVMRDAHNKTSKRHGDPSYEDLIAQGFLTDAVLNYVTLLGWSPRGEQEIFSLDELKKVFELSGVSKSPAIFDIEKLRYFNSEYIRAMSAE